MTRVCVIGAGPSGITAAKNCLHFGLEVVVYEKNDRVGGNWVFDDRAGHSSVYENTHLISSKTWSQYEDFPMPADYPDYPNHRQLQAYFQSYAEQFQVMPHIRFNTTVQKASPDGGGWRVILHDGTVERFDALMVCNGHHWNPKWPTYPGKFTGSYLHSHDFKGINDSWRGKRVLVIGGGNSACDVAVETARVAGRVVLSMRSPQWFVPKFIFGMPADVFSAKTRWLPRKAKQWISTWLLRLLQGRYSQYGLPENPLPLFSQHATANSDFLDFIRHGRIHPKPGVERLDGARIHFKDGSSEEFDTVVACTGFWITFPFFDFIDYSREKHVPLYRHMLHPQYKTLYFIGLFQPFGCIWPLADFQAMLACAELTGRYQRPADLPAAIAAEKPHYAFDAGIRHSTQVDYHLFRRELRGELITADIDIGEQ